MKQNRTFKKYIMAMLGIMVAGIILCNVLTTIMFRGLKHTYYNAVSQAVGENELSRYGVLERDFPLVSQQTQEVLFYIGMNGTLLVICGSIVMVFILYQNKRSARMNEMTEYIRQIERGIYSLKPEENDEDDLSVLKNELYKVMVLLKEAAVQSEEQRKALSASMSDISHQLKTPLTSITLLLDNMSESENMDADTRRMFLAEMTKQLTHINWLVQTLLKLSRLDSGTITMRIERMNASDMLRNVLDELELMAGWKQISFQLDVKQTSKIDGEIYIYADYYWIKEAFLNLVKNAIEHSPDNSVVGVTLEQNDVYTAVTVHNDGDVISEQDQLHIFERFYRSSGAVKDSVGIGLSLVKTVIEQHSGYIAVTSSAERGTEFMVKLFWAKNRN